MAEPPKTFSDIKPDHWIMFYIPERVRPYARLMRLDRPIGTWLLLLPCWWSVALASVGLPNPWLIFFFGIGAVVMRGAGCIINDIYDRRLDQKVERTRIRPLASGEIKLWQAAIFLGLLFAIGFIILLQFNRFAALVGALSLILVAIYPLMKRITWWPQLFLGFTFNWGALMGWAAVRGRIDAPALILYAAGIFWTLGYDTIYAHQDKRDDELVGIKSSARLLGAQSWPWVAFFYITAIAFLAYSAKAAHLSLWFYFVLIAAVAFMAAQLALWKMDDPENCLIRFRANRDFGLIVLAGIILGRLL